MQNAYKGCVAMRFFKTVLSIMLCICLFAGCGSADKLSAKDIADEIKNLSSDTVSWVTLDKSKISTYFGISDEHISDFTGYLNDAEEHFDMIAVFRFENADIREDIIAGINTMTAQISESYKLANISEATKINNRTIAETANTVILCIMDKQDKITKYLTDDLGAEIIS